MDLTRYKKIIVFGGSFDPPHWGHVKLPMMAMKAVGADAVAYVPSGWQPLKPPEDQTSAHHRLAMLRIALRDVPQAVVLTDELDHLRQTENAGPTYSVDTLQRLWEKLGPATQMYFLIGGDCLGQWHLWRKTERIIELAEPLVMVRPPETPESLLESLPPEIDRHYWKDRLLDLPNMDISSTEIRRRLAQGIAITDLVPPGVEQYIHQHGLYGLKNKSV